jgi:hypothetical protein
MGSDYPANKNDKRNQKDAKEPLNCKSKPQGTVRAAATLLCNPDSKKKSHFQEETKMPEMGTFGDHKPSAGSK